MRCSAKQQLRISYGVIPGPILPEILSRFAQKGTCMRWTMIDDEGATAQEPFQLRFPDIKIVISIARWVDLLHQEHTETPTKPESTQNISEYSMQNLSFIVAPSLLNATVSGLMPIRHWFLV
eukprot:s1756_g13.t1